MPAPKIAYVLQIFPYLTETFVYREILALREAGLNLITVANRPPAPENIPPDVAWLQANTHYIFPLNLRKFTVMFFAQIFFLFRHTHRYIKAVSIL